MITETTMKLHYCKTIEIEIWKCCGYVETVSIKLFESAKKAHESVEKSVENLLLKNYR